MSKLKNGAIMSYIYLFTESLLSIFFTPFLVKYLGDSEYGVYGLAATVSSYILLFDLGVGNALARYFVKYRVNNENENQRKLLGVSIMFYFCISLISLIVLAITIYNIPSIFSKGLTPHELIRAKYMFWIVGLNAVVTLIESPFKRIIIGYEKFILSKATSLIKVCLRVSISVLVLLNGGLGGAVLVVNLLLSLVMTIFEIMYVIMNLHVKPTLKGVDKYFFKEIITYSSIILLQMIATQINGMLGQLSISIFISSASTYLAVYYVAINLSNYFQSIGGAVNSLLMPGSVRAVEKKYDSKNILRMMVKISRIQIIVLGIIYVVFLTNGKVFIRLWVGESKQYAYYAAAVLMFPQFFSLSQGIGSQLLWAMNKHKIQAILKLCATIANIGITIILVNVMEPVLGASIGTGIALLIGDVVVPAYIYKKEIKISIAEYYKYQYQGLLPCLLITLFASGIINHFIVFKHQFSGFLMNCIISVIIYLVLLWKIGLNKDEKELFYKRKK